MLANNNASSTLKSAGRKRAVTSCLPCYTRKQKCNRRYPCDHCTRRRSPEECAYQIGPQSGTSSHSHSGSRTTTEIRRSEDTEGEYDSRKQIVNLDSGLYRTPSAGNSGVPCGEASLTELFGYFEDSDSNTVALLRNLKLDEQSQGLIVGKDKLLPREVLGAVQLEIERMPDRQILNFLVQFFGAEVNWMDQLVYHPSFLAQYDKWWGERSPTSVSDIEFAVLILRICSYALQFLPSPLYTVDRIRGVALTEIRITCDRVGDNLAAICASLDSRGDLTRVQHLLFAGLRHRCGGRMKDFWETLNSTIRVAQRAGMHTGGEVSTNDDMDELQKEMRRRTFCNLYVWDSLLSRQLDRMPFLPDNLSDESLPRMHLGPDFNDVEAPELFTERLLQARLASFWRNSSSPDRNVEYNVTGAEERYDKFCNEFLAGLHPAFALMANRRWDEAVPMLSLQRQRLHITIFDSICWNFRPVLLLQPSHIANLPLYKQVLISSQKRTLAVAALKILEAVSVLHTLLGASHTRFTDIVFYTFEAAVILVFLCSKPGFPDDEIGDVLPTKVMLEDLAGFQGTDVTKERCSRAAQDALSRLRMLAEVSDMADVGARAVAQLLDRQQEGFTMATETADAALLFGYLDDPSLCDVLASCTPATAEIR